MLRLACARQMQGALGSAGQRATKAAARVGLHPAPFVEELWRSYSSLAADAAR